MDTSEIAFNELSKDVKELSNVIMKHYKDNPEYACTEDDPNGRSAPKVAAKILEKLANKVD